jgi:hypothetical protein
MPWFQGHWGFQYYMEAGGAPAMDSIHPALKVGDDLVVPVNNVTLRSPQLETAQPAVTVPKSQFLATQDQTIGASFYASMLGPLPFALGPVPPERIVVFNIY